MPLSRRLQMQTKRRGMMEEQDVYDKNENWKMKAQLYKSEAV